MSAKNGKPCGKCGTSGWYANGRCKICTRERNKKWKDANQDKANEAIRKWKAANKGLQREYSNRWHAANRDKSRELCRKWIAENPDRKRESRRKWIAENPDKRRASENKRRTHKTNAGGAFTDDEWKVLCNQYENKCLKCGEVKPLSADHVMPVAMGGSSDISNIQPLCGSCNSSKGATFKDYRNKPIPERWKTISIFDVIGE